MSTSPIPTIDVSPLFVGPSPARTEVDQAIGHALQTYQSFMAIGLPDDLRPDAVKMKRLFSLFQQSDAILNPMGTVHVNPKSDRTYRGYTLYGRGNRQYDVGPEPPVTGPAIKDIERLIEPNVFPADGAMPGWREAMLNYFRSMENFSKLIVGSLARFLKVSEMAAVARYAQSNSTLRIIEYPTMPGDSAATGLVANIPITAAFLFSGKMRQACRCVPQMANGMILPICPKAFLSIWERRWKPKQTAVCRQHPIGL